MIEINNDNIIEIINFVKVKFPEASAALLTGSFATKKEKKNSDIDLMIFSESISQSFVEKIKIGSQKYDIIYLSTHYNFLLKELYTDIYSRYGVYTNMISTSKILFDKNNVLKDLIFFSKNILIKEYASLDSTEIEFKRKLISNALEDIEDIDSFGEFYFSSALIVEEMTNLILSNKLSTIGRGKNKARELKKVDSLFYEELTKSIIKNDKEEFKRIITEKLDFFGGILETYSTKEIPSITSNGYNRYEILLKRKNFNNNLLLDNYSMLTKFLSDNNINLLHYYYQNEYLVIIIESKIIDERMHRNIISWLIAFFRIPSNNKIVIKASKSKLIPFVNKQVNEILEKDLSFTNKFVFERRFNNNFDILKFNYLIVSKIIDDFFIDDKQLVYEYLYHSNILNGADLDSFGLNYFQLIDYRKKIIDEIDIISKSLSPLEIENVSFEDYYYSLEFPKVLNEMDNYDLNLLMKSFFCDEGIENKNIGAKLLILNFYLKFLFEINNSNNQLSIITNILKNQS